MFFFFNFRLLLFLLMHDRVANVFVDRTSVHVTFRGNVARIAYIDLQVVRDGAHFDHQSIINIVTVWLF